MNLDKYYIIFAVLLYFVLLYIFFTKYILNPVSELSTALDPIKTGNYNEIKVKSDDEIGALVVIFNKMIHKLKSCHSMEEKHNLDLQTQVEQRTHELNQKLKDLEKTKLAIINMMEDMDITNKELTVTKEQLKENIKELKLMDQKKDEFISITAHELKTPLTSIRGFTELLKNDKIMKDKDKRKKYFSIILDDTIRLEKLITDILDLSRLDLGTMKFNFVKITSSEIIENLKSLVDLKIKEKKLKSEYKVQPNIPSIYTDKERIIQVLTNLISNSIKYTEKGYIKMEMFAKDNKIFFRVIDTGLGIPKKDHRRIFDRFYQVDSSYTRKVGGSGLGLAICKGIVEALGGKITVTSTLGKGATFEFYIINKPLKVEKFNK